MTAFTVYWVVCGFVLLDSCVRGSRPTGLLDFIGAALLAFTVGGVVVPILFARKVLE